MSVFEDIRQDMVDKLRAAGVAATDDPRAVAPFVLVGVPSLTAASGIGAWDGAFPVWIVSPPPGDAFSLRWRLDQLEAVYGALGFAPAYPDMWGDKDAPAYLLTYPRTVPNPDC